MKFNWKTIFLWSGVALVLMCTTYVIYVYKYPEFPWKRFGLAIAIIVGSVVFVALLVWAISNFFMGKDDIEFPKKTVDSTVVLNTFKECYARENGISYIVQTWNNNKVVLANEDAIEIRNVESYPDPSKETSDHFMTFEAVTREGHFIGARVYTLRTDYGEEWIRKNWNYKYKSNELLRSYKNDLSQYPLSTSLDVRDRMQSKGLELLQEGYSKSEVDSMINPYLRNTRDNAMNENQDSQKVIRRKRAVRRPTKEQEEEAYLTEFDKTQKEINEEFDTYE